jgi:hypothetical protein
MRINRLHKTHLRKATTWTYLNWPVAVVLAVAAAVITTLTLLPGPSLAGVRTTLPTAPAWPAVPASTAAWPDVPPPTTTTVPPPPVETPAVVPSTPTSGAAGNAVDSSSAAAWAASPGVTCIRQHESGDNYSDNTGNGYFGAYQDELSTWDSHGGTGLPSDASPAVQDAINYAIYLSGGWGQWGTAGGCGL